MKTKEQEYRELFLVEANDNIEELNNLFVELEKDHSSQEAINAIFRITHTLKGNAMGMGFEAVADLSHVMEDVMLAIKSKKVTLGEKLFGLLFRANDKLGDLVKALVTEEKVNYLGIKTSLGIHLKNEMNKDQAVAAPAQMQEKSESIPQAAEAAKEETVPATHEESAAQITFSDVIQIPVKKMDELLNQIGQLMIERDRLIALSEQLGIRAAELDSLKRITSSLQYSIMNARMVQIGFLFNKFHRILRDAAAFENKQARLVLKGTEIEIDRNILKIISDSLVHLVRNAVSHGIESEAKRKERGKPVEGTVTLDARHERDSVVILVTDDGSGIDHEIIRRKIVEKGLVSAAVAANLKPNEVISFIFESGFSNAEQVTEVSGRGVGMDVVKRAVESIGGQVRVETTVGKGTTMQLFVPSSLALKGTLLFEVGGQEYAIALSYTESVVNMRYHDLYKLSGGLMANYRDEAIPIIFLKDILQMKSLQEVAQRGSLQRSYSDAPADATFQVIIVNYAGRVTGIIVDKLLQQKEIIEKPLVKPIDKIKLLSGTTILGSGNVCPVIDIAVVTDLVHKQILQHQPARV